jgi:YHS domain-containing protein
VELVEKRRWVLGTHPWGVIHQGRTYMCAGPEEQKRFLANPDRYAPVLSGNDVVLSVERGMNQPGRREYGIFYRGQVYLFTDQTTLDAFRKNPRRYLDAISGAPASETASRR